MKQNPQTPKIILVDRTEVDADGRGSFLKIYGMGGETYRIAEKRNPLWSIFQNAKKAEPILTLFETYLNNEYIADARAITDEILKRGVQNLGEKIADRVSEDKNRSTALSYAKDLVCAGKVELGKIYETASDNYQFIKGNK